MVTSARSAREKLIALYRELAAGYVPDRALSLFVLQESVLRAFRTNEEQKLRLHALVQRILKLGVEQAEFVTTLDAERVAGVLGSVYMGTLFMWLCTEPVCDLNEELTARLSLVLDGLAPQRAGNR